MRAAGCNVYMIRCEGEDRVVEAPSFAAAIERWRLGMLEEYPEPEDGWHDAQPDSVEMISRDPVIR